MLDDGYLVLRDGSSCIIAYYEDGEESNHQAGLRSMLSKVGCVNLPAFNLVVHSKVFIYLAPDLATIYYEARPTLAEHYLSGCRGSSKGISGPFSEVDFYLVALELGDETAVI